MTSAKPVEKSSTPTLQWLESEEETSQIAARKKGNASTPANDLQWLESEAEQESATTK